MKKTSIKNIIQILPNQIINQIAAGEIIERPANVLKELIENSLDANSKRILISIEKGGKDLISVTDNGHGLNQNDLIMSIKRHATSKISTVNDLNTLKTLGFRGEALPSIAAVSNFKMYSRHIQNNFGFEMAVKGGLLNKIKEKGCPVGTTVKIKDLFFNIPARQRFLKNSKIEAGHLSEILLRLSLSNPEIAFKYTVNDRLIYDLTATKDLRIRTALLLGKEISENMIQLNKKFDKLSLSGLISSPNISRISSNKIYTFVNGRFIRSNLLLHAINETYKNLLPKGRKPIIILKIEIDSTKIDINVHPSKNKIKFQDKRTIYNSLVQTLKKTLSNNYINKKNISKKIPLITKSFSSNFNINNEKKTNNTNTNINLFNKKYDINAIGQLKNSYIICTSSKGLKIIDQHAAHEKILYEKLKKSFKKEKRSSQDLLKPIILDLTSKEAFIVEKQHIIWEEMGLKLNPFGGNSWTINSIPTILAELDSASIVRKLIEDLSKIETKANISDFLELTLRSIACHSAIKNGKKLNIKESQNLILKLFSLPPPITCPHGRPIVINISIDKLNKEFERKIRKINFENK